MVKVIRKGKGVFEIDLDPECVSRNKWKERQEEKRKVEEAKIMIQTAKDLKATAVQKPERKTETILKPKVKVQQKAAEPQPATHPPIQKTIMKKTTVIPAEKQMTMKTAAKRKPAKRGKKSEPAKANTKRKSKK